MSRHIFSPNVVLQPSAFGTRRAASSLSGLGVYNTVGCDSFEQALKDLEEVVKRGEGVNTAAMARARTVLSEETGWNPLNRSAVWPTNCQAQTARIGGITATAMNDLPASLRFGVAPTVLTAQGAANLGVEQASQPMPLLTKVAIIGGISVAGLIAIAVITGQVSPLLRLIGKK